MIKVQSRIKTTLWLSIPLFLFYIAYFFNHSTDLIPTGFIQEDNVSYVAYAKQYIDEPALSFFYSNPLSDGPKERIYIQPQLFLLILLLKTGLAPGYCLVLFNILFSIASIFLLVSIYDLLYPAPKYRNTSLIILSWGGGILAISGIILGLFRNYLPYTSEMMPDSIWNWMFFIDPANGWWGLNFGRAILFTMEAFYHAIFLLAIYLCLQKKWKASILTGFILSLSHPFTGLELLLILTVWAWLEKICKNIDMPLCFPIAYSTLLVFHLWYYLHYLMQFPEHAIVYKQYSLNWRLRFFNMIPAYCLAGGLFIISFFRESFKAKWKDTAFRLGIVWLIIVFLLINHEWFVTPRQPIHFTRGYFYTAIALIGVSGLPYLIDRFKKQKRYLTGLIILLFLSDNLLWFTHTGTISSAKSSVRYIFPEQRSLLQWLDKNTSCNSLIISSDGLLPYLSTVYTKAYALLPHPYTTPFVEHKKKLYAMFLENPSLPAEWKSKDLIWVVNINNTTEKNLIEKRKYTVKYTTAHYIVAAIK